MHSMDRRRASQLFQRIDPAFIDQAYYVVFPVLFQVILTRLISFGMGHILI